MESFRNFLFFALFIVSFLFWQQWSVDTKKTEISSIQSVNALEENVDVPIISQKAKKNQSQKRSVNFVKVVTDKLEVIINEKGDITNVKLLDYSAQLHSNDRLSLLEEDDNSVYIAQSGLIGSSGPDRNIDGRPNYSKSESNYLLVDEELSVPITWTSNNNLNIVKSFKFHPGKNYIDVEFSVSNGGSKPAELQIFGQLKRSINELEEDLAIMPTYKGSAYSTKDTKYEKYDFDDILEEDLRLTTNGGWVAMLEHYFVSAWIPNQTTENIVYTKAISDSIAIIGFVGERVIVEPGEKRSLTTTLYVGPKLQEKLEPLASGLELTIDYGFLWWLSQPLFLLLKLIFTLVGNWGAAIVIATVILKSLMYPLTKAQYTSMGKVRALQPQINKLKERHGEDKLKLQKSIMELYKKEQTNPFGGCLPVLIQMPIFLALYYVLLESIELRHTAFSFWISDLSSPDPYYILPALFGISMYLVQKLNPSPLSDPIQQKLFLLMPVFMSIFFAMFPSGLVLYWLVSNMITYVQAKIIYSSLDQHSMCLQK